ncbi:MAG: alpha/beta hydrolase [Cellvibrionaceae bacterium]
MGLFFSLLQVCHASNTTSAGNVGDYEIIEKDFIYATIGDLELFARSYRPKTGNQLHAVVEVHGGAWNLYDRTAGELYNRALASAGLYVMAIDFRQGPNFKHPLGSRDASAAIRYLKLHSKRLKINPNTIGIAGSSSGGHLALLTGLMPDEKQHLGTPIVQLDKSLKNSDGISAAVNYIIALWPVSNPTYRFAYAKQIGRETLVKAHLNYFGNEASMEDANVVRVLEAIKNKSFTVLPPVLIVQPGDDTNIPREMTQSLVDAYQNANGSVDYAFFPKQPHAFAHRPSEATNECIELMINFIRRQLEK